MVDGTVAAFVLVLALGVTLLAIGSVVSAFIAATGVALLAAGAVIVVKKIVEG